MHAATDVHRTMLTIENTPMRPFVTLLSAFLLFAMTTLPAPLFAAFTGTMTMGLKMPNGTADVAYRFGRGAQRMDMAMRLDRIPDPLRTTVITRTSRPDEATVVNHRAKSWSVVNLRSAAESAMLLDFDSNYRLARVGVETVRGYRCEHVRLSSTTDQLDFWMSKGIADFSTFRLLQSQNPRLSNTSLSKTLQKAGVEGFPVRIVQKNENGLYVMELKGVAPGPVPESAFSVPAGYARVAAGSRPVDNRQKAHLKKLMQKMKDFER